MLKAITIDNFKCFEHLVLRCAPLTLMCGLNGMGKSSVIQALLCLRGGGSFSGLGAPEDVLYEGASADSILFELQWTDNFLRKIYRMSEDRSELIDEDVERAAALGRDPLWEDFWQAANINTAFGFGRTIHVGAERLGPRKWHDHLKWSDVRALDGGGERTLSYLSARRSDLLEETDPRCVGIPDRRLLGVLEHWLQQVTPGVHLDFDVVRAADALIAGFSFDQPGDVRTRRYRATNVGFGLSYVLPVLAALLVPKGHLCLIENPEAHLHPRGQAKLAELAVRAAVAGVQVMVETHSDHFLDGVRIGVREGLIRPQDTAIHYFERDGDGKSVVVTPEIDEDGRLSHWPAGFFDQHDDNLARLLAPKP